MKYIALNVQTTGPRPSTNTIIEIAVALVDENFQEFFAQCWPIHIPETTRGIYSDPSYMQIHAANGLLAESQNVGVCLAKAEAEIVDLVNGPANEEPTILGDSLHKSLPFIGHWMPGLWAILSEDVIDARTLRELWDRSGRPDPVAEIPKTCRALPELRRTLALFQASAAAMLPP